MTDTPQYDYGTNVCSVREQGAVTLDGRPERAVVERGLERAGFEAENDGSDTWVKHRRRVDDDGLVVARAIIEDDRLRVEPESVVGAVSLLPGTTLEIEPKIGWEPLVEMMLTVYGLDRTESYFGVPLSTLLSETGDISRLVALLAINYVRGVRTVRREGLVRDIGWGSRAAAVWTWPRHSVNGRATHAPCGSTRTWGTMSRSTPRSTEPGGSSWDCSNAAAATTTRYYRHSSRWSTVRSDGSKTTG